MGGYAGGLARGSQAVRWTAEWFISLMIYDVIPLYEIRERAGEFLVLELVRER